MHFVFYPLSKKLFYSFILRDFYACALGSLALLIHPHALNLCSLFPSTLSEELIRGRKGQTGRLTSGPLLTVNSDEGGRAGFCTCWTCVGPLWDCLSETETEASLQRRFAPPPLPPAPPCSLGRLHCLHPLTPFRLRLRRAFRYTYPYLPILKSSSDVGGEAHHAWRGLGRISGGYFMDYT